MPRAKTTVPGHARRRKILKAAKGNYSGRRKLYKTALQTAQRAGQFAYVHRRTRKRDFRRLWIVRINAAARINGLSYSTLISGPMHGHAISKHIQRTSENLLQIETGSLYPCVHRLEAKGWIAASWELSDKG